MTTSGATPALRLTPELQALVLEAEPTVAALVRKLARMFTKTPVEDIRQTVWTAYAEVAPNYDRSQGSFGAFGWKRAYGMAVDQFSRDARQSPLRLARRAFGGVADGLTVTDDPFVEDHEILAPIKAACHEGAFRMFFGATFEAWRTQGEEGLVDHLTRQKAFRALQSAFTTLATDDWQLLELYFIECRTWADVGAAFDISERHAKRRAEGIREKLRRELLARGVKGPPPDTA